MHAEQDAAHSDLDAVEMFGHGTAQSKNGGGRDKRNILTVAIATRTLPTSLSRRIWALVAADTATTREFERPHSAVDCERRGEITAVEEETNQVTQWVVVPVHLHRGVTLSLIDVSSDPLQIRTNDRSSAIDQIISLFFQKKDFCSENLPRLSPSTSIMSGAGPATVSPMLKLLRTEPPTTDVEICCRFEDIATEGHAAVSAGTHLVHHER